MKNSRKSDICFYLIYKNEFLSKIFEDASSKFINNTEQIVKEINAFEVDILKLTMRIF